MRTDFHVLALDIASRLGWAYGALGQEPTSGSVQLVPRKEREGLDAGELRRPQYRAFRKWVKDFLVVHPQTRLIVYESPIGGLINGKTNINTVRLLIGLAEHAEEVCPDDVMLREAGLSEVRKYFVGSGRPPKGQAKRMVMDRCRELGWEFCDDNAADALALWAYQCFCIDKAADVRGR